MVNLIIPTGKFQSMVASAAKGSDPNNLLGITSMMRIELKGNTLTLETTDRTNYLKIIEQGGDQGIDGEDFECVVPVELFSKLIAKIKSVDIKLSLTDSYLLVEGSGQHKIALPTDGEGLVTFPTYTFEKIGEPRILHASAIRNALKANTAAKSNDLGIVYGGYYIGDAYVITTNNTVVCVNEIQVCEGGAGFLLSPRMMALLALSKIENIPYHYNNGHFLFETPRIVIYGEEFPSKEDYPVGEILKWRDHMVTSQCAVSRIQLQSAIDRLALFIQPYDRNVARLTFTPTGIELESKQASSVELVEYDDVNDYCAFTCLINIPMLKAQLDTFTEEVVNIYFGSQTALKIEAIHVLKVLALFRSIGAANSGAGDE